MSYIFDLDNEGNQESRKYISRSLDEYNIEHTSMDDNVPLDLYVKDEHTGDLLGGIIGRTSLGVLFINYVFLHP